MGFKTPNPLNMPKEDVQLSCSKVSDRPKIMQIGLLYFMVKSYISHY